MSSLTQTIEENPTQSPQYPYILTRLFYSQIEVNQALFLSLLEHNTDDALYWVYELYYSGFYEETMEYLHTIYTLLYSPLPSNQYIGSRFSSSSIGRVETDEERAIRIGSLVLTLSKRDYDLTEFIRNYYPSSSIEKIQQNNNKKKSLFFQVSKETIQKYADPLPSIKEKRRPLRTEYNSLFLPPPPPNDILTNTLRYTEGCPYWEERVEQYQDAPITIVSIEENDNNNNKKTYKEKLRHLVPTFYNDYGDIISSFTMEMDQLQTQQTQQSIEDFKRRFLH